MSMISEQIKALEAVRGEIGMVHDEGYAWTAKVIDDAINTIRIQREKIAAYASEKSLQYYNSGLIPAEERQPEEGGEYLVWIDDEEDRKAGGSGFSIEEYDIGCEQWGFWYGRCSETTGHIWDEFHETKNVKAWMPLPEPPERSEDEATGND